MSKKPVIETIHADEQYVLIDVDGVLYTVNVYTAEAKMVVLPTSAGKAAISLISGQSK